MCPVCGDVMCDHTPEQRGQTYDEMMRPLTEQEVSLVGSVIGFRNQPKKKEVACKYAQFKAGDPHPS